ncbi:MAG: nitrile hydratase subunit alpha [Proteobacteria bacterium]|nr:nitrile hydratase subunit alpha [Pseudomonadota bacterium]
MSGHDHHDHDHHEHGLHDHGDGKGAVHPHPRQPDTEDSPFNDRMVMAEAVGELMIEKGIFSADDLRAMLELIESKSPADGAKMVARAWVDPGFRKRMLDDVLAAATELGIDAGSIPIRAVENTNRVHNVIVCTLCSCYPRLLIGLPPDWYKSRAYRSRAVREPRKVLAEFGTAVPDDIEVRVHDSTADLRYMVIPRRPAGTDGWDEQRLASLVSRDSMIGVAFAKPPAR